MLRILLIGLVLAFKRPESLGLAIATAPIPNPAKCQTWGGRPRLGVS